MNVSRYCLITMLAVALLATPALATKLGDPAPALKIKEWVKGQPVELKAGKGKQVYVIEFWATWCGPCRTSIPHLTKLQKKYSDRVTFVGVTSEKNVKDVQQFVTKMGDRKVGRSQRRCDPSQPVVPVRFVQDKVACQQDGDRTSCHCRSALRMPCAG